jgi:hypothetical protein
VAASCRSRSNENARAAAGFSVYPHRSLPERQTLEPTRWIGAVLRKRLLRSTFAVAQSAGRTSASAWLTFNVGQNTMPSFFIMVLGTDLVPSHVTKAIGMRPSFAWKKGDQKTMSAGDGKRVPCEGKYEWGGWKKYFSPPESDVALVKKMMTVAESLMERRSGIEMLGPGCQVFFVSLIQSTSRLQIPPRLHQVLGTLSITLQIDYWPTEELEPLQRNDSTRSVSNLKSPARRG